MRTDQDIRHEVTEALEASVPEGMVEAHDVDGIVRELLSLERDGVDVDHDTFWSVVERHATQ